MEVTPSGYSFYLEKGGPTTTSVSSHMLNPLSYVWLRTEGEHGVDGPRENIPGWTC